jgi:hypothetical protein
LIRQADSYLLSGGCLPPTLRGQHQRDAR